MGTMSDPVAEGFVASLSRPGGNVTGVIFTTTDVTTKRLGQLHDLVPKAELIGPALARVARYSGRYRPAWRISHTGVQSTGSRRSARRKRSLVRFIGPFAWRVSAALPRLGRT